MVWIINLMGTRGSLTLNYPNITYPLSVVDMHQASSPRLWVVLAVFDILTILFALYLLLSSLLILYILIKRP